jgi:hypothetical protein
MPALTALEANRFKLLNLIQYMDNCPKEKGEEELKHPEKEIQAGKLAGQRLAKDLMQSKDFQGTDSSYSTAQAASKVVSRDQGKAKRL